MASSNIKLFDENKANIMTDEEYLSHTQRINGVQTGIASSTLENKAQYQTSLVAYAIAQLMLANGKNAMDSDAVSTFVSNLSGSLLQKVVDLATVQNVVDGILNDKFVSPKVLKEYSLSDATAALWGGSSLSVPNDILKYAAARYGTCTTAATTAAKVVTLANFVLSVGAVIGASFTYKNTASSSTLNVNGTGAKSIYFNGNAVSASQIPIMAYFQYDGTYWQLLNGPSVQIATGSYMGTGTYGYSNPTTISFPFQALALILGADNTNTSCLINLLSFKQRATDYQAASVLYGTSVLELYRSGGDSSSRNSISFYSPAAAITQFNNGNTRWIAIG